MDLKLRDKVVIVTGSTGAIGSEICRGFLAEGSMVVPFYRPPLGKLDDLFAWSAENHIEENRIVPIPVDLESSASLQQGVEEVYGRFSRIDILVNNAGWTVEKPFLAITDEEWDALLAINLTAVARLSRLVIKIMMERKQGVVVNISSTVAQMFGRGVSAYAAAKAAVNRLTEVLALEMGKKGIRVNTVCPGVINTPMSGPMVNRLEKHIFERTPLQRIGETSEVVPAVLFLASEATASFITGQHFYVNGGVNLGL